MIGLEGGEGERRMHAVCCAVQSRPVVVIRDDGLAQCEFAMFLLRTFFKGYALQSVLETGEAKLISQTC